MEDIPTTATTANNSQIKFFPNGPLINDLSLLHQQIGRPMVNSFSQHHMNEDIHQKSIQQPDSELVEALHKGNLADITLIGSIIKLLRNQGNLHFTEITSEISKFYHNLRRCDGSKYEGDISKAVRGCLSSSNIFYSVGNDVWAIQDKQAQIYEANTTQKLKTLITKKRTKPGRKPKNDVVNNDDRLIKHHPTGAIMGEENQIQNSGEAKARKKAKRSSERYQQVYDLLNSSSKALKANDGTAHLIQNPFKGLKGNESFPELWQKLGSEKFVGIMQCFEYFSPLIEDYLKKNNHLDGPCELEKSKLSSLENIKTDLNNLYKNLLHFEKGFQKDSKK